MSQEVDIASLRPPRGGRGPYHRQRREYRAHRKKRRTITCGNRVAAHGSPQKQSPAGGSSCRACRLL